MFLRCMIILIEIKFMIALEFIPQYHHMSMYERLDISELCQHELINIVYRYRC